MPNTLLPAVSCTSPASATAGGQRLEPGIQAAPPIADYCGERRTVMSETVSACRVLGRAGGPGVVATDVNVGIVPSEARPREQIRVYSEMADPSGLDV